MNLGSSLVEHILSLHPLAATIEFYENIDKLSEFRFIYFCKEGAQFKHKLEELSGGKYNLCSYTHSEGVL